MAGCGLPAHCMTVLGAGKRYGSAFSDPPPVTSSARAGAGFDGAGGHAEVPTSLANFVENLGLEVGQSFSTSAVGLAVTRGLCIPEFLAGGF